MVAKKDFNLPKHPECELASNNMVVRAMQSLKSRGFVSSTTAAPLTLIRHPLRAAVKSKSTYNVSLVTC